MKHLTVNPPLCIGCSACSLICSATWQNEFNPSKAFVQVAKDDKEGTFQIIFSSKCKQCKKCGLECPTGAIALVEKGEE